MNIHPLAETYPINPATVEAMAEDMRVNGYDEKYPILVDSHGTLIDGRTRLQAAELAGVRYKVRVKHFESDAEVAEEIRRANDARRGEMTKYQRLVHAVMWSEYLGEPVKVVDLIQESGYKAADVAIARAVFSERGELHEKGWLSGFDPVIAVRRKNRRPSPAKPKAKEAPAPTTLLDFATAGDRRIIETGKGDTVEALERVRAAAAARGWAPEFGWQNSVPVPHVAKGVSTLHDADGVPKLQWVKSSLDERQYQEAMHATIEALSRPLRDLGPLPPAPEHAAEDLCNVYILGDPHIGMLAWGKETLGKDYDLEIAQQVHTDAIRLLVAESPAAGEAVLIDLGDGTHADNYGYLTQSGHRLDGDSRFPKMADVAVDTFQTMGDAVLRKHNRMYVKKVPGNHDLNTAPWFTRALYEYWRSSDRVEVDRSPAPNLKHRFGKVLIAATHGDRVKGKFGKRKPYNAQDFLSVMANDWSQDWGETEHRYAYQGHIHSSNKIEASGGVLESFQTLAPNDAWHAAQVYRSGKSMTRITMHREHGEIGRGRVPISMVWKEKVAA